ncbi:MAG: diacylglycerol kinase [Thermoanaerobaculia bacterium]|nr:diacylglycerol kinase [Thermoanaerobaculia bacterium]
MRYQPTGASPQPKRTLRKLRIILGGLRHVFLTDFSAAYKLVVSVVLLGVCLAFRQWIDLLVIVTVTGLVLVAEIQNSAIEALCDFVEPRWNERIGVVKDIAAAGVGVAIAAWVIVVVAEVWRLWQLWSGISNP